MKFAPFFLLLFAFLTSCNEEVNLKTEGEKIAEQINTEITNRNITTARIFVWTGTQYADFGEAVKPNFKIEGSFLIANNTAYYNFNKLERFEVNQPFIFFYFTK